MPPLSSVLYDCKRNLPDPSTRYGTIKDSNSEPGDCEAFLLMTAAPFLISLLTLPADLRLDKRRDVSRHRRGDIAEIAHQMDRAKLRLLLPGEISVDPRAQLFAREIDVQQLDQRADAFTDHAVPVRTRSIVAGSQAGLLLYLPRHVTGDVNRAVPDVVAIGRSRREVDAASIRGMSAHFAQDERAIGAAQCA